MASLISIGVLAAGCGSSKSSKAGTASTTATSTATPTASTTGGSVTRAQALAYAHEVNLRASDVPQMAARTAEGEKANVGPTAIETSRCAGAASPTLRVADVHSPTFAAGAGAGTETVKSDVEVKPSNAVAQRDAAALRGERGVVCIRRLLQRLTARTFASGARISSVSVAAQPAPLAGARFSFDIRVTFTVSAASTQGGISVPAYIDALGFISGPAEVSLSATRAKQPPSAALEHQLLSLLFSRASAHAL